MLIEIGALKNMYKQKYEYSVEYIEDDCFGKTNFEGMKTCILNKAREGWRLISVSTNNKNGVIDVTRIKIYEYTCLIFEREIQSVSLYENLLGGKKKEYEVVKSNFILPFAPKTITMSTENEQLKVSISVQSVKSIDLSGVVMDLIITNIFEDEFIIKNVCFLNLETNNNINFKSEAVRIEVPDDVLRSMANTSIIIHKYIINGELIIEDSLELQEIEVAIEDVKVEYENMETIQVLKRMNSATDMLKHIKNNIEECRELFNESVIAKLENVANHERLYGNLKEEAIRVINEFLDFK